MAALWIICAVVALALIVSLLFVAALCVGAAEGDRREPIFTDDERLPAYRAYLERTGAER